MCQYCFEETSEEIAAAHGAKTWDQRKNKLEACRQHGLVKITPRDSRVCDVCQKDIDDPSWLQSGDIDICDACSSAEGWQDENFKDLEFIRVAQPTIYRCDGSGFGSLLDWVPFAVSTDKDNDDAFLLINLNPESPSYQNITTAIFDDHGRCGYFNTGLKFAEFLAKIDELETKDIRNFMDRMGYSTYYG